MAVRYGSKYTETSVTLNDCVDQLLVGIVRQIRLTKELEANPKKKSEIRSRAGSLQVGPPNRVICIPREMCTPSGTNPYNFYLRGEKTLQ